MAGNSNFAVWNTLANTKQSLSYAGFSLDKGNTRFRGTTGGTSVMSSSLSMPSGKWYIEIYSENNPAGGWPTLGICKTEFLSELTNVSNYQSYSTGTNGADSRSEVSGVDGKIYKFGASTKVTYGTSWADGDVLQIAVDIDAGKWYMGKNNTYFNSGNPATGTNAGDTFTAGTPMSIWTASYSGASYMYINSGQDSSFSGNITAGTATDGNGFGNFKYTPPSGFLALCSANLPTDSNIDPSETDDDHPAKNFGVVTYTGNGSSRTITGLGFQPDLIWAKRRNGSRRHYLVDSSRGFTKYLHPEGTYTEGTSSTGVTSATSDGFALGGGLDYVNASTHTYVAWCWRCNGGTTSTNTDGALASTVQANQALGFSISLYTSNGTGQSFGHGLGAAPDFFMIKKRDTQERNWMGWHTGLDTASTGYIRWNLTNSQGNDTLWNNTAPSATVINVQKDTTEVNNPSGATYVCYAWRGIEGYSKFGKFEGNSDADGPFVYTGFRPRLVFCKAIDATENWQIRDTERHNNTGSQTRLYWNSDAQEGTASTASPIDFLANGFKVRGSNSEINTNTIIYGAWGDVPFKYGNTHDNG